MAMNIKPFDKFFEDSDEIRLMKDLEDLGANERTWSEDEIQDVLADIDYDEYFDCSIGDENAVEYSFNERRLEIQASYVGGITSEFDDGSLWNEIKSDLLELPLNKEVADEDERVNYYTLDEIETAFNSVNWDRVADRMVEDIQYDEIDFDYETSDRGEGTLTFYATPTLKDKPDVDQRDIISEIMDNL